ncbi:oligopeptidase A [Aeromonas taiwanensis]|uniref:oligopeptidase A n=1 Tax=Aeromonas taiwanensis TaxID=633417 RepID=UPI00248E46EB|nr:oligopeptidase A [Aeromonas taiwanensis]
MTSANPLLDFSGLPRFDAIQPEHIAPAIDTLLEQAEAAVKRAETVSPVTWNSFVVPLDDATEHLWRAWGQVGHLQGVVNTPELREAYNANLPKVTRFGSALGQNLKLFEQYRALAASAEAADFDVAQRKVLDNALRDFRLGGAELDDAGKARYSAIREELSALSAKFSQNVLDATDAWSLIVEDAAELAGLPEDVVAAARAGAEKDGKAGWKLTLQMPCYLPVQTYAAHRPLREALYRANALRASEFGDAALDNSGNIDRVLALRAELAALLGFANYAELSLATKMADKPEQVVNFLTDLAAKSLPQGKAELDEIRAFAAEQHGQSELAAWDLAYYAEKLKQHKFSISDEQLRPYFPAGRVVKGLFEVVKRVFGMKVRERLGIDTWHPDVRFYDIFDANDELRGSFYLDLYAREHKQGGAWMDVCLGRRYRQDGSLQKPVAYLTCNFNGPVDGKPALFTHNEVVTLFHEFGHGIHHMLTRIDVAGVAGINGVAWDAVELPSQFLENWCWESEALAFISGHHETGEPLPADLLEKMMTARNFQAAMQMLRQLEFALFDFRLHQEFDPANPDQIPALLSEVRSQVAVMTPPAFNRFQHSFSHIFAGGYAAGYYSYKWAEVLSADAFSRFEEEGIFNPETGHAFLKHILEKGGSREPMELFRAFRGREPQVDALLRHSGIAA